MVSGVMAFRNLSDRLRWASGAGDLGTVIKLLKHKVSLEERDQNGDNCVALAVKGNHVAILKLLLEAGANSQNPDCVLNRPVHFAAKSGSENALILLIKHGASTDVENCDGLRPIDLTRYGSDAYNVLAAASQGQPIPEYQEKSEVPEIPTWSIPVKKVASASKGKVKGKGKKKAKKGKRKK